MEASERTRLLVEAATRRERFRIRELVQDHANMALQAGNVLAAELITQIAYQLDDATVTEEQVAIPQQEAVVEDELPAVQLRTDDEDVARALGQTGWRRINQHTKEARDAVLGGIRD